MGNEHNPVALLVSRLQQEWLREVSPYDEIQWVRWLMEPGYARLYEGFLKLESTEHGVLPDIPIVFLTPFEDPNKHSKSLVNDWLQNFETDKTVESTGFTWDAAYFRQRSKEDGVDFDRLLIELLESFQKALPNPRQHLVLALLPYTLTAPQEYLQWMEKLLRLGLPKRTRIMVFDHRGQSYFEQLQLNHKGIAKSLLVELDLDGAMKKLALTGDPNDPEVQFRQCMVEMGNSAAKNNRKRLHLWGEKGLEVTQRTGDRTSFATAHAVYAGMLFQFKEYDTIDKLLHRGLTIAKQCKAMGDATVNPVLLQLYGYMASSAFHQKETEKAIDLFCEQAKLAASLDLGPQAIGTYITAYTLVKKRDANRYSSLLEEVFEYGRSLPKEQFKSSGMHQVAWDYYNDTTSNVQRTIDEFMNEIEGADWKKQMEFQEHSIKTGISVP